MSDNPDDAFKSMDEFLNSRLKTAIDPFEIILIRLQIWINHEIRWSDPESEKRSYYAMADRKLLEIQSEEIGKWILQDLATRHPSVQESTDRIMKEIKDRDSNVRS